MPGTEQMLGKFGLQQGDGDLTGDLVQLQAVQGTPLSCVFKSQEYPENLVRLSKALAGRRRVFENATTTLRRRYRLGE